MIIWGTTSKNSTVDTGNFHCPRCGRDKQYNVVSVNRFFTLYFIPIIPLGEAGRYLECRNCSGTFSEEARNHDPDVEHAKVKAIFETGLLQSMIAMASADGTIAGSELETIAIIMTKLTDAGYEPDEIREATKNFDMRSLDSVLKGVADVLNAQGKALVLTGICHVAYADGTLEQAEKDLCYRAGKQLGFRKKDVDSVLEQSRS